MKFDFGLIHKTKQLFNVNLSLKCVRHMYDWISLDVIDAQQSLHEGGYRWEVLQVCLSLLTP